VGSNKCLIAGSDDQLKIRIGSMSGRLLYTRAS